MIVRRDTGEIEHKMFVDLPSLIPSDDLLVLNSTKVFRARLLGTRDSGAPAEVLLLRNIGSDKYEAMVHPGGKLKPGRIVHIAPGFDVEVLDITERRTRIVRLTSDIPVAEAIEKHGHVPLPPYIARSDSSEDVERYQTVYAKESGSVAAPTAGLHFTDEILNAIPAPKLEVILHVGAGTFKPVEVDDPAQHLMHEEWYSIPASTAAALNQRTGKIWAVGTTTVRTLESAASPENGQFQESSGDTSIFIRQPYKFRAVDHMITNFHLPRSTLIMLVAAFAGYDLTMRAYRTAIQENYRFYSYGDAMVII